MPKYERRAQVCLECRRQRLHAGWGLCHPCYSHATNGVRAAWRRRRYATDPEYRFRYVQMIRRRERSIVGSHTYDEWQTVLELFAYACAYCGCDIKGCVTKDHILPVSAGGTDDIENVVPACRRCNSRKGAKSALDFIRLLHEEAVARCST
jgi:5-methylcytosine-specific restriction endonuclease McrA